MARPSRSQRPPQASQSQPPRATQAGRARRAQTQESEEENIDVDLEDGVGGSDKGQGDVERKARDLVRLALFHEQKRTPLKRDEITKKVLGAGTRMFPAVFQSANTILQNTFGMQLVELHPMPSDKDMNEKDAELLKNTGVKKKATQSGTKSYILRSSLDLDLVQVANRPDAALRELEQTENADENEELAEDDNPVGAHSTGSILSWNRADQLVAVGVIHAVLMLILVEDRVMSDSDLRMQLKRFQLHGSGLIPLSSQSTNNALTLDTLLATLVRQGYLERARVGAGAKGAKRPRATQAPAGGDDEHLQAVEWRWGPRALAEVGEKELGRTIAEMMGAPPGGDSDDDEDAVGPPEDEATQNKIQVIYKGIERAAGGELYEWRG